MAPSKPTNQPFPLTLFPSPSARAEYNEDAGTEDQVQDGQPIPPFGNNVCEAPSYPRPGKASSAVQRVFSETKGRATLPENCTEPNPEGWSMEAAVAWRKGCSDITGASDPRAASLIALLEEAAEKDKSAARDAAQTAELQRAASNHLLAR